ncbi:hypothetical protein MVEG_03023 [Podila verticillata NRRL 6337]|nr:hypothetical protein MVEG_03023 [Podila verticillata NRRL 6337]
MQRRQQHGVAAMPWTWPTTNSKSAGTLDFGLLGGASFDHANNHWNFAQSMEELAYSRRSGLSQMLPRQRKWEPAPLDRFSAQRSRIEWGSYKNIDDSVRFIDAVFPDDPFPEDLLVDVLKEATKHEFELNQYDPYMGNVCATGQYLGLPVIATPAGPTAASLGTLNNT